MYQKNGCLFKSKASVSFNSRKGAELSVRTHLLAHRLQPSVHSASLSKQTAPLLRKCKYRTSLHARSTVLCFNCTVQYWRRRIAYMQRIAYQFMQQPRICKKNLDRRVLSNADSICRLLKLVRTAVPYSDQLPTRALNVEIAHPFISPVDTTSEFLKGHVWNGPQIFKR